MPDSRFEDICPLVCPALHTSERSLKVEEEKLAKLRNLAKGTILAYSVFIEYGYVKHGGCG